MNPFAVSELATASMSWREPVSPCPKTTSGAHLSAAAGAGQAERFTFDAAGSATSAFSGASVHAAWEGSRAPVVLLVASRLGNVTSYTVPAVTVVTACGTKTAAAAVCSVR